MQVLHINRAIKEQLSLGKKVVDTGICKRPVKGPVTIQTCGLAGDTIVDTRVHGGEDQALYLYSAEDYAWWSEQLGRQLPPGSFGENLTISSFHRGILRVGDRVRIGRTVELEITAPRIPCAKLAAKMGEPDMVRQFIKAERPGAYARVLRTGTIHTADPVLWQPTRKGYISVRDLFIQWHQKAWDQEMLAKTLNSPISRIARRLIEKRAGI